MQRNGSMLTKKFNFKEQKPKFSFIGLTQILSGLPFYHGLFHLEHKDNGSPLYVNKNVPGNKYTAQLEWVRGLNHLGCLYPLVP